MLPRVEALSPDTYSKDALIQAIETNFAKEAPEDFMPYVQYGATHPECLTAGELIHVKSCLDNHEQVTQLVKYLRENDLSTRETAEALLPWITDQTISLFYGLKQVPLSELIPISLSILPLGKQEQTMGVIGLSAIKLLTQGWEEQQTKAILADTINAILMINPDILSNEDNVKMGLSLFIEGLKNNLVNNPATPEYRARVALRNSIIQHVTEHQNQQKELSHPSQDRFFAAGSKRKQEDMQTENHNTHEVNATHRYNLRRR